MKMYSSIFELLSEITVEDCIYVCKSKSFNELQLMLLQYYVDLMSCSHRLKLQDVDNISSDLLLRIYNSCTQEVQELIDTSEFMSSFFDIFIELEQFQIITSDSINFLLLFINHDQIRKSHHSVAICHLLLAYHLKPLTSWCSAFCSDSRDLNEMSLEANESILEMLDTVVKNIPNGVKHKCWIAERIVREFCEVIEKDSDVHISGESNALSIFRELLEYENGKILTLVISSIGRLCDNHEIENPMIRFLFSTDEHNRTVINLLEYLLKSTQLQSLMADLIKTLSKVLAMCNGQEIIADDVRMEIYASKFVSCDRCSIQKACFMISVFEVDFTLSLIKTFEYMKASMMVMANVIANLPVDEMKQLSSVTDFITLNIKKDEKIARRATQVFQVVVDNFEIQDEMELLSQLPKILKACLENEKIFSALLSFLINFDGAKLKQIFDEFFMIRTMFISTLLQAFGHFKHFMALKNVMIAFKKISISSPKSMPATLKALFNSIYADYLQAENNSSIEGSQTMSSEMSLIKMNLMIECYILNFLDYFHFDAITIINTKHLQDSDDPSFPFFARFHITVCKMMWNILMQEKLTGKSRIVLPYNLKFIADSVNDLAQKLMGLMTRRDMNLLEAQMIFTSLTDMLHFFHIRPVDGSCLSVSFPKVTIKQMTNISEFAKFYIFNVDATDALESDVEIFYDTEFQKMMLTGLAQLVKNNKTLLNLPSLFTILQFYRDESEHADEMELMMKSILERPSSFIQTIGLVIFQFAKQEVSFKEFEEFSSLLSHFLHSQRDAEQVIAITWKVCAFVLTHLLSFIQIKSNNGADRLRILDLVQLHARTISVNSLKKLVKCIPKSINEKLSEVEMERLQRFVNTLSNF